MLFVKWIWNILAILYIENEYIKFHREINEASGVTADPDKEEAVKAMKQPRKCQWNEKVFGNHPSKFLLHLTDKTQWLRDLLRKPNM